MKASDVLPRLVLLAVAMAVAVGVPWTAEAQAPERGRPAPAAGQTGAGSDPVATAMRSLAEGINRQPGVKGKSVGVVGFSLAKGGVTEIGVYFSDLLEVELIKASGRQFEVVTRRDLCEVIRENKLWVADRFDPKLHEKLGGLSEADFLATGRIVDRGRALAVTVRLLDTEKGRQIWADNVNIPLDEGLRKLIERPAGIGGCEESEAAPKTTDKTAPEKAREPNQLQVQTWFDKPFYRVGDSLRIGVRVNRDAYVTLVNLGTSGQVTILFPNGYHPNNLVRAGQQVLVPPADAGFALHVKGPTGFDQVIAIATEDPVQFAPTDFSNPAVAFRSLERLQTRSIVVGAREKKKMAPSRWAEHVVAVEVIRGADGLGREGAPPQPQ